MADRCPSGLGDCTRGGDGPGCGDPRCPYGAPEIRPTPRDWVLENGWDPDRQPAANPNPDATSVRLAEAHQAAMLAKATIFKAQDAVSAFFWNLPDRRVLAPGEKLAKKIEKRLARVRTELEALDREWIAGSQEK